MSVKTKTLKHKSYCCDAKIYVKVIEETNFKSEQPYCSRCLNFPEAPLSSIRKALKMLNSESNS